MWSAPTAPPPPNIAGRVNYLRNRLMGRFGYEKKCRQFAVMRAGGAGSPSCGGGWEVKPISSGSLNAATEPPGQVCAHRTPETQHTLRRSRVSECWNYLENSATHIRVVLQASSPEQRREMALVPCTCQFPWCRHPHRG